MVSSCRNNGTISQELRYPFTGTVVQFWQESSGGFWSYLQSRDVLNRKSKEDEMKTQSEIIDSLELLKTGTMYMLRNDLLNRIDRLLEIDADEISLKTVDNIRKEYNTYRKLNGNSDVVTRWELLMDKITNNITN